MEPLFSHVTQKFRDQQHCVSTGTVFVLAQSIFLHSFTVQSTIVHGTVFTNCHRALNQSSWRKASSVYLLKVDRHGHTRLDLISSLAKLSLFSILWNTTERTRPDSACTSTCTSTCTVVLGAFSKFTIHLSVRFMTTFGLNTYTGEIS